jgi:hypothetical protein
MIGVLGVGGYEVPRQSPAGILSTLVTLLVLMIVCWLGIIAVVAVLEARTATDDVARPMTYEPVNATRPATLPAITATEAGEETTHATQTKGRGSSRAVPAGLGRDGRRQERLGLVERPQHGGGNPTRGNSGTGGPGGVEGSRHPGEIA